MNKKVVALLLTAVMTASVLSGCGQEQAPSSSEVQPTNEASESTTQEASSEEAEETGITFPLAETLSFTGSAITDKGYKLSESKGWQMSLDRANIEVELLEFDNAELSEKTNLLLAGGDYPDFFFKNGIPNVQKHGVEEGILIPLEDLIREYAPNLTALLDELDGWKYITATDGHVYMLPCIQEQASVYPINAPMWINKKWMDNLGLSEPTTMEELDKVLRAFKEQDANGNGDPNDEVPFTFATNQFMAKHFLQYLEDGLHLSDDYLAVIDGELVYYPLTDGFKDNFLSRLASWYKDGIIDQNAFTQKYDEMTVNAKAADIHGMFWRSDASGQVGKERADDYVLLKVTSEYGLAMTANVLTNAMTITDKCEHPEVLVAWADYFYTEEGSMLAEYGVEGESYKLYEDGSYSWLTPEGVNADEFKASYRIYGSGNAPMLRPSLSVSAENDPSGAKFFEMQKDLYSEGTTIPYLLYNDEETTRKADLSSQINDYITVYTAEVVTGKVDLESSFADFQETLKQMGAEELFEIHKSAYERGGN